MSTSWQPRYESGSIPAVAASPLQGGTFVVLTGTNIQGGELQVETCGLGQTPFGVTVQGVTERQFTGRDPSSVELRVWIYRGRGLMRMVPGAAISGAGVGIQSDQLGRAIPAAAAVAASLSTGLLAFDNALAWVAVSTGTAGNSYTVAITNPGGTAATEVVTVTSDAISVAGRTVNGAITSTANDIIAAILASTAASALITVENEGTSDGTGVVAAFAATSLAGGAASGGGTAIAVSCCAAAANDPFVEVALY